MLGSVERLCCKRPVQCPASSIILTHPSAFGAGEDTLARWRGGCGVNILEDARHSSVLYTCKFFVLGKVGRTEGLHGYGKICEKY